MDGVVAGLADHEGLASPFRHELCPRGLWSFRCGQVSEFADLVHIDGGSSITEFAPAGEEPGDQLLADGGRNWYAVVEGRFLLPFQRDFTEACDQWFPVVTVDAGLEACAWPVGCLDGRFEFTSHLCHR